MSLARPSCTPRANPVPAARPRCRFPHVRDDHPIAWSLRLLGSPSSRRAGTNLEKGGGMDAYIGVGHGLKPDGIFDPGAVSGELVEHDLAISVVDAYAEAMRSSGQKVADESHS